MDNVFSMKIEETGYDKSKAGFYGSKFLIGNGYMGYRGTLEEYGKSEYAALTLANCYDQNGKKWREPVNAPNPIRVKHSIHEEVSEHFQGIDIGCALHYRHTVFQSGCKVEAERFCHMVYKSLICLKYEFSEGVDAESFIDSDIWDMNGPHLCDVVQTENNFTAKTIELNTPVCIAREVVKSPGKIEIFASVCHGEDAEIRAKDRARMAKDMGYESLLKTHKGAWCKLWERCKVEVLGDETMNTAINYSIYLLLISAPFHTDRVAIPARGLSGQVYKGAMFWDTELYMLPLFLNTLPEVAKNLVNYRIRNLKSAKDKAKEYGYTGAFYPWECQENGVDYCTCYNLNDIFTGRPIRTYFRDKQVHISADVAYGIIQYYDQTKDVELLLNGGADVLIECVNFAYSYACYKPERERFELHDVTGADEYHERVNNDAYTNIIYEYVIKHTKKILLEIGYSKQPKEMELYVPKPNADGIIEQFDGYFQLEDITPNEMLSRRIHENEYLGSPSGLAVETQVAKQADVVLAAALFDYPLEIRKANLDYYTKRTEHGSSLSECIFGLLAAKTGYIQRAYDHLTKAACIDLNGSYKLYAGDLYIGGTHPAANGGTYMLVVLGLAGLSFDKGISAEPMLPSHWKGLSFNVFYMGECHRIEIKDGKCKIHNIEVESIEEIQSNIF